MPKATAVFDANDSRRSGALVRINGKMLALRSRIAKFAAAFIAIRAVAGVVMGGIFGSQIFTPATGVCFGAVARIVCRAMEIIAFSRCCSGMFLTMF